MRPHIIFNHGKESGPMGTKIKALGEVADGLSFSWESIDYRGIDDPEIRSEKLVDKVKSLDKSVLLVGSSMGAYVSLRANQRVEASGLFLMAPAVYMPGYDATEILPKCERTLVIHGWQDDIVPVKNAIQLASKSHCELVILNDDHVLSGSLEQLRRLFTQFLNEVNG